MVMVALFGSLFVGLGMIAEIRSGALERLMASAPSRPAIVLGRILRDVVILVVQAVLVTLVAVAMGMRPRLGGLVLMLLLMAVTGVFASGVSYGLALAVRQENVLTLNWSVRSIQKIAGQLRRPRPSEMHRQFPVPVVPTV